jgi:hypothetical protein
MARPGSAKNHGPEHPPLDDRLAQACAEVAQSIQRELQIAPSDPEASSPSVPVAAGWALVGDSDERRLRGAAELIGRLRRNEDEIQGLCAEVLERYEEVTLVYRLCERLGSVDGERAMARLVLDEAARVLGARSGGLWLREGEGLNAVASFPATPVRWNLTYSEAQSVMRDGKPWVQEADPGGESAVAVPLPSPGGPIGLMVLWGRSSGRAYRSGDVKLLTAIATLTAAFVRNERLAAEARRSEARARDDEIARQVHRGLLPHGEPTLPGLEISGCCRSAENVGGDYYGYISMPDGSLGLVMADVSGHGVAAALYMAAAKGALQAEARRIRAGPMSPWSGTSRLRTSSPRSSSDDSSQGGADSSMPTAVTTRRCWFASTGMWMRWGPPVPLWASCPAWITAKSPASSSRATSLSSTPTVWSSPAIPRTDCTAWIGCARP